MIKRWLGFRRRCLTLCAHLFAELLLHIITFLDLECCLESSASLLVHFCSRSDAVNRHIKKFTGPNGSYDSVNVQKDRTVHTLFCFRGSYVFWMHAWVDNAIHVKVEIVKLNLVWIWLRKVNRNLDAIVLNLFFFENILDAFRVLVADPAKKGRNAHMIRVCVDSESRKFPKESRRSS